MYSSFAPKSQLRLCCTTQKILVCSVWGSSKLDDRCMNVANWSSKNNFIITNDGSPTHCNSTTGKEDAIDLSMVSMGARRFIARRKVRKDLSESFGFSDHYIVES